MALTGNQIVKIEELLEERHVSVKNYKFITNNGGYLLFGSGVSSAFLSMLLSIENIKFIVRKPKYTGNIQSHFDIWHEVMVNIPEVHPEEYSVEILFY